MTTDLQCEFTGFNPDDKIKATVSSVAESLHWAAPSDSTMKLVIERTKDAMRASCRIASHAGHFVADAMSDDPVGAVRRLEKKLRKDLAQWKVRRFARGAV